MSNDPSAQPAAEAGAPVDTTPDTGRSLPGTAPAGTAEAVAAAAAEYPTPLHAPRPDYLAAVVDAFRIGVGQVRDVRSRYAGPIEVLVPVVVVIIAALTRFLWLDHPHAVVFDETYYVRDGWTIWHLGYEGSWPKDSDAEFAAGKTDIFTTNGTRVVHPPLGKWIIGFGMMLFGGDSSFGWRFSTALLGVGTVLLTYLIARRLTRSVAWAGLAGLFLAVDGLSIVMSRVALLDGVLTFFITLGVLFIVYDHRHAMAAIARDPDSLIGVLMWRRPWVIAAGLAFGAACAVKWSGMYALAAFGIYLVVTDIWARRRAGVKMWFASAIGRQAPVTFVLFVPPAFLVYVASWTGWLVTSGGYSRGDDANPFIALIKYHISSYEFHVGLSSPHPYASQAWQWPLLIRPTSMYWEQAQGASTVQAITGIPNPLLWWAACAAAIALVALFVMLRDWRGAIPLTALAATYLPWLAVPDRTIFMFYTVAMMPFLVLSLVLVLQGLAAPNPRLSAQAQRRGQRGWVIGISVFALLVVAVSVFFFPLWSGMPISYDYWKLHMWLPTWI